MSLLDVTGLAKRFGGVRAVSDVDLSVEDSTIHSLIGPNGAGKTTVLNLITKVLQPDGGRIVFAGQDLGPVAPHRIQALGIARTFQHVELFRGLSVLENVLAGCHGHGSTTIFDAVFATPRSLRERRRQIDEALGWLSFVGIEELAPQPAALLTAGQARLVGLARALAGKPRLVLMDEVVAGLNEEETARAAEVVLRIKQELKISALVIEHDMRFVMQISDEITVLDFGTPIATGTPAEIQCNERVIEAYIGTSGAG